MGVAFFLKKKIFIFNNLPEDGNYLDEIKATQPILLKGNLNLIK